MKIKLTEDLPIDEKHGCTKGRIFEATHIEQKGRDKRVYFVGDAGEECAAFSSEYEFHTEGGE